MASCLNRRSSGARLRLVLALAALAALGACAPAGEPDQPALIELERLAFVPSGQVHVGAFVPIILFESPEPLLVDVFESTRGEWKSFLAALDSDVGADLRAHAARWRAATDAWPASYMTLSEARRFAAWRGMRLPTPSEWMFCALGPERRLFPWGAYERQDSVANTLEVGLGRPAPVGTFEGGKTPRGLYDMLGNVAEWVDGDVLARDGAPAPGGEDGLISALGGSFRSWSRPIFQPLRGDDPFAEAYLARRLHPRARLDDVGLRCVGRAAEVLPRLAARVAVRGDARARLVALGERWGRAAVPVLADLATEEPASEALELLLEGASR